MNTGAMKRRKGQVGEREFFRLLSDELGTCVRRNIDQARNGGADCVEVPGWAIEVKRHETGFREAWWDQACEQADCMTPYVRPAVAYRASRQPWRVRVFMSELNGAITCHTVDMSLEAFAFLVREGIQREATP